MGSYKEMIGDLIKMSLDGYFDVCCQGNNCFNLQKKGLSLEFVKYFKTNTFEMEQSGKGDISKLGKIDYRLIDNLYIVNCYIQYYWGTKFGIPLDYDALKSCLKEINTTFKGKKIGLPTIGCGLAGGDFNIVKDIIKTELKDCDVTVVHYKNGG